ncbi:MAG: hypothetical protein SGJ07_13335 [Rhodospirillaceae bacterium]|nr:hypothetical protein [Rhodospirillaceae bacterium]
MQIPAAVGRVLSKLEANTRLSIGAAERQALDEMKTDDNAPIRSVLARVMLEDWRNGWDEFATMRDPKAALRYAVGELHRARTRRDKGHWYVDWKRGHVLRYAARAFNRPQDAEMILQAYRDAYEKLSAFTGLPPKRGEKALRSLVVDWAETLVYLGDAQTAIQYFEFTFPWRRRDPDDWHVWAHAFALHQQGHYAESRAKMEPLVEKLDNPGQGEPARQTAMIAQRPNKKIHPSYYNDMRLTLAASYARDGKRQKADAEVRKFQQLRQLAGDAPWTLALEAERGAFIRNSAAEKHWLQSLRLAGLPEGKPVAEMDEKKSAPRKRTGKAKPKKKAGKKSIAKPKRKTNVKKSAAKTKRKAPKRKTAKRPASKRKAPKRKTKTRPRAKAGSKAAHRKR